MGDHNRKEPVMVRRNKVGVVAVVALILTIVIGPAALAHNKPKPTTTTTSSTTTTLPPETTTTTLPPETTTTTLPPETETTTTTVVDTTTTTVFSDPIFGPECDSFYLYVVGVDEVTVAFNEIEVFTVNMAGAEQEWNLEVPEGGYVWVVTIDGVETRGFEYQCERYECGPDGVMVLLPGDPGYDGAWPSPDVLDCDEPEEPPTVPTEPTTPVPPSPPVDELPFTGLEDELLKLWPAAVAVMLLGWAALKIAKTRHFEG